MKKSEKKKKEELIDKIKEFDECSKHNWNEERDREKWDKVNEFAENLELLPNEEFWICGPDTYTKGKDIEIAHMINGLGCYPPEEEQLTYSPLGD